MRHCIFLLSLGIIISCTPTKKLEQINDNDSHAKVLEMSNRLFAFRMPIDSISDCFFKEYDDTQLLNHYINQDILNSGKELKPVSRKVTKRNIKGVMGVDLSNQEDTKIVAKISIDKMGRVIAAELLEETTAILDQNQKRKILAEFLAYQYQASQDAPCIESGKLTVKLTRISTIR